LICLDSYLIQILQLKTSYQREVLRTSNQNQISNQTQKTPTSLKHQKFKKVVLNPFGFFIADFYPLNSGRFHERIAFGYGNDWSDRLNIFTFRDLPYLAYNEVLIGRSNNSQKNDS
jgi:hypothetical protein